MHRAEITTASQLGPRPLWEPPAAAPGAAGPSAPGLGPPGGPGGLPGVGGGGRKLGELMDPEPFLGVTAGARLVCGVRDVAVVATSAVREDAGSGEDAVVETWEGDESAGAIAGPDGGEVDGW